MRRREFITIVGGAFLWPLGARAQQAGKTYRVGLLATGGVAAMDERRANILEGLAANGFFEGRNLEFEVRSGEGRSERLSEFAAALQAANVDAIVTFGYPPRQPRNRQPTFPSSSPARAIRSPPALPTAWRGYRPNSAASVSRS